MSFLRKLFRRGDPEVPQEEERHTLRRSGSGELAKRGTEPLGDADGEDGTSMVEPDQLVAMLPDLEPPSLSFTADEQAPAPQVAAEAPPSTAEHAIAEASLPALEPLPAISQQEERRVELPGETDEFSGTHNLPKDAIPTAISISSSRSLSAWAMRDLGRVRTNNQDSCHALVMTLPRSTGDATLGLFIVADGMGGHQGGEIASRLAVETVLITILENLVLPYLADEEPSIALQTLLISAVQEANARIWQEGRQLGSDMGTTCTVVLLLGGGLYIAHVGDSRAYVMTGGELRKLTTDHSAVGRLIEMGQITELEASEHPMRNQLYRTIGQQAEVQVDFMYHAFGSASHLLVCSDGLWGMVPDSELAAILEETLWPEDACRRLIARANMLGGEDNIAAVVATLPVEGARV